MNILVIDETRLAAQIAIGLVFLLSAPGKFLNPKAFAQGVVEYKVLPGFLAYGVGLFLIPLEIFLAASHLTGWLLVFAAPLGLATIVCFMIAVAINLKRGRGVPCHCFGGDGGETISWRTIGRLLLLFIGESLLLADPDFFTTSHLVYPDRIASFSELGLALFWATFLLVVGFWLLSISDIIELLRTRDK